MGSVRRLELGGCAVGLRSGRWLRPGRLWGLEGEVSGPSSEHGGGYQMLVGEGPRAKRVGSHGRMFFDVVLRSRTGTGW